MSSDTGEPATTAEEARRLRRALKAARGAAFDLTSLASGKIIVIKYHGHLV